MRAAPLAIFALALIAPLIVRDFTLFQFAQALVYAIAALGLYLLTGLGGQISLGASAFFALGAYCAALGARASGAPAAALVACAALAGFVAGLAFGAPARRLKGVNLAMATFALAAAVPPLLKLPALSRWTGGAQGIALPGAGPSHVVAYYCALGASACALFIARNIARGRIGRALQSVRDDELAAQALGVDAGFVKALAFGLAGAYAAGAGAFSALLNRFVAPDSFTLDLSIAFLVALAIGGARSAPGAFIGGFFMVFAPNLTAHVSPPLAGALYGLLLIGAIHAMPDGVGEAAIRFVKKAGGKA
ncbi:MAG: branched-chain amino acid ABC transporter permease [Hyphomicrobiales bacterium]|nr:branched-chain amino acid ABC transporter permease [Hyphomicrobiales bacterium]